jgi:hypothetical protein
MVGTQYGFRAPAFSGRMSGVEFLAARVGTSRVPSAPATSAIVGYVAPSEVEELANRIDAHHGVQGNMPPAEMMKLAQAESMFV